MAAPSARGETAPAPIRLTYDRTPAAMSCPDETQLREAIAARLGSDPFSIEGKRLLQIAIDRHDDTYEARITLVSEPGAGGGERVLRSTSPECRDLAAAITLTVSMALDPLAPGSAGAATAAAAPWDPPGATAPAAETTAVGTAAAASASHPSEGPAFEVSAAFLGAVGVAATPSLGVALQVAVAWPSFSLGLEGDVGLPVDQQTPSPMYPNGSVETSQLTATVVPCLTRWHLGVCGLISVGASHAIAKNGPTIDGSSSLPFVGLGGRLFGSLPLLDWLEARLQLDLLGQVTQTSINLTTSNSMTTTTVWSSPPVSGSLALAMVARFR